MIEKLRRKKKDESNSVVNTIRRQKAEREKWKRLKKRDFMTEKS